MTGVTILIALDPDTVRRAKTLLEVWPILLMYLAAGPLVGWLAAREQEWERALEAISDASREISTSLDLDRTLSLVMQKASETLPMDAGALFLFDDNTKMYQAAVSHNLSPERVKNIAFAFDQGVPGWVVNNRQPLIIDDAALDLRVHPIVAEGVKSVLAIPLITREQVVGVLNLFCQSESHAFDNTALQLAQVYADQAAVFIENSGLVEKLRQAAAELEARVEQRTNNCANHKLKLSGQKR
jgi:GAF domain-containing protein